MINWKGQDGLNVAALWDEGKSCGEIAAQYGVTRSTVTAGIYRLKERGLIKRVGALHEQAWTRQEDEAIKSLSAKGKTYAQIAAAMDRPLGSVKAKIERMVYAGQLKRVADMPGRPKTLASEPSRL